MRGKPVVQALSLWAFGSSERGSHVKVGPPSLLGGAVEATNGYNHGYQPHKLGYAPIRDSYIPIHSWNCTRQEKEHVTKRTVEMQRYLDGRHELGQSANQA